MKTVTVSNEAYEFLKGEAWGQLEGGVQLPDGRWRMELDDDAYNALLHIAPPDVSEAVLILKPLIQRGRKLQ